jgi:glycosyltransferase involved in cell wall biosynthesis
MKKILWLPAWYPNDIEKYAGDFIQRHAKAVALFNAVQVIHVLRDKEGVITKNIKEFNCKTGNLNEQIIYYHTPVIAISLLDKLISHRRYQAIYRKAVKNYIQNEGIPSCAHVHVIGKNGMVAWWMKKKYRVLIVVTEHWTGYLAEASPNFSNLHWLFKNSWHRLMKESKGLNVVSSYLGAAITRIQKDMPITVIPNVVDDSVFFPVKEKKQPVHFIHISTLGYQKNAEAILQAFAIVKKSNSGFQLSIFGPDKMELRKLCFALDLQNHVSFYDEVPQLQLAAYMQQSHALILYSRYETFGCVLIEANACGVPVIVSDIPVFHEIVEEGVNGFFVPGENPEALAQKIIWFMQEYKNEFAEKIAAVAKEKYNYRRVGKLFDDFYRTALQE